MKKISLLVVIIISIFSCENDPSINPNLSAEFTIGEILSVQGDYNQLQSFTYDSNGKLISVIQEVDYDGNGSGETELTSFIYNGDELTSKTFEYSSSDTIHRIDSIAYLPNGLVEKTYSYYNYEGEMRISWVNEYQYDDNGRVIQKTSYDPSSPENQTAARYYWSNGNVSKIESLYQNEIRYEADYSYDNGINYKLNNPFFNDYEISLATKNNIKEVKYTDYSGLLDLACNPCTYNYEYNDFSLPKKVSSDFGPTLYISYDVTEVNTDQF